MNDSHAAVPQAEVDFHARARSLGATKEHADRVLRQAIQDAGRGETADPYELARLQLVADLNQNPK